MLAQRDQMVAVFGHDLRGLLNALTVNAELFLRRDGEGAVESARSVRLAVGHMDRLITSLLDYVRLKADKLEVVPRPFDAGGAHPGGRRDLPSACRVKSLSLTLAIPDTPLRARADHDRIFQVLSNLLSNAIKFSSVKGKITVQATTSATTSRSPCGTTGPESPKRPGSGVRGLLPAPGVGRPRPRARALYLPSDHPGARRKDLGDERSGSGEHLLLHGSPTSSERASARSPDGVARGDGLTPALPSAPTLSPTRSLGAPAARSRAAAAATPPSSRDPGDQVGPHQEKHQTAERPIEARGAPQNGDCEGKPQTGAHPTK